MLVGFMVIPVMYLSLGLDWMRKMKMENGLEVNGPAEKF